MFKFGFGENNVEEDKNINVNNKQLDWFSVYEFNTSDENLEELISDDFSEKQIFSNAKFKLIHYDVVVNKLKRDKFNYINEAESQHLDLLPSKYEGGLKIWECTYDLGNYILEQNYILENKLVLDLGCGVGVIGLLSVKNKAKVHFQDYNIEVIKNITIPNVRINNCLDILKQCKFYSGDWKSFANCLIDKGFEKYDYIFTSETIYNADNHVKLFNVFKSALKKGGIGLVAAKTYYFGVGGGMRQFEELVNKDANFQAEIVWNSNSGLNREILQITWKV